MASLRQVVGSYVAAGLPLDYQRLSAESLGDMVADKVSRALEAAATHAYYVKTTVTEATWEGARELRPTPNGRK